MFIKKSMWTIFYVFLTACQMSEVSHTPVSTMQNETASPVFTLTALPTGTLTPLPPSPTIAPTIQRPTQAPVERLAFTVTTDPYIVMYPDTIIAFVNSDGTDFETPSLFEPFREKGGVTGKYLVWSPNGRYLAFDGADKVFGCGIPGTDCLETNYGTFLADYSQKKIVQYVESTLTNSSWSPDSQKLVLSIDEKQSSGGKNYLGDLYILNVKNRRKTQLTNHPSSDLYPAWSPDGQWIAFIRYAPNLKLCSPFPRTDSSNDCDNASLYVIRPDGTDLQLLAQPIHIEAAIDRKNEPNNVPSWSPDSKWLAIMVENEGEPFTINQEIALVNIETRELKRLTHNNAMDVMPVWSPDGKRLAFVSGRDGNEEIYVMNSDGTNQINLTQNPTCDYAPTWSPSGNYIAFMSCRGIYTMNADGTDLIRINGDYFSVTTRPSWLPILKP